jgi:hypothetical protein
VALSDWFHEMCCANSKPGQGSIFVGAKLPRREACVVEQLPAAVAGPGVALPSCCRLIPNSGSAESDFEVRPEDFGQDAHRSYYFQHGEMAWRGTR